MSNTFAVGDRVVVESPVWTDRGQFAHSHDGNAQVGSLATILDPADEDGDYWIETAAGLQDYVHADGLLKVDDLDAIAAERACEECACPFCIDHDDAVPAPATPLRDGEGTDPVATTPKDERLSALREADALGAGGAAIVTVANYILTGSTR